MTGRYVEKATEPLRAAPNAVSGRIAAATSGQPGHRFGIVIEGMFAKIDQLLFAGADPRHPLLALTVKSFRQLQKLLPVGLGRDGSDKHVADDAIPSRLQTTEYGVPSNE